MLMTMSRWHWRISPEENRVYLGRNEDVFAKEAEVKDLHFISGDLPAEPVRCRVKIRYRQKEQPATVTPSGADSFTIEFDEPQRAITPGQAVVLYDGELVLGGGTITQVEA